MTPWTAHQLDYCVGLMKSHGGTGIPQAALARYLESQRNRALWAGEPVIATGLDFTVARVRAGEWESAAAMLQAVLNLAEPTRRQSETLGHRASWTPCGPADSARPPRPGS